MPLGLGRRPDTQGQCNHPTPRKTTLRRRVGPPGCRPRGEAGTWTSLLRCGGRTAPRALNHSELERDHRSNGWPASVPVFYGAVWVWAGARDGVRAACEPWSAIPSASPPTNRTKAAT